MDCGFTVTGASWSVERIGRAWTLIVVPNAQDLGNTRKQFLVMMNECVFQHIVKSFAGTARWAARW